MVEVLELRRTSSPLSSRRGDARSVPFLLRFAAAARLGSPTALTKDATRKVSAARSRATPRGHETAERKFGWLIMALLNWVNRPRRFPDFCARLCRFLCKSQTLPQMRSGTLKAEAKPRTGGGGAVLVERLVRRIFDRDGRCWQRVAYYRPLAPAEYDARRAGRPADLRREIGDKRDGGVLLADAAADRGVTLARLRGSRRGRAAVRRRFSGPWAAAARAAAAQAAAVRRPEAAALPEARSDGSSESMRGGGPGLG